MVLVVLVVIVVVALFSFVLYKLWQKKKRAEQYARLLKLFEEDDELEVELGLRDWIFPADFVGETKSFLCLYDHLWAMMLLCPHEIHYEVAIYRV